MRFGIDTETQTPVDKPHDDLGRLLPQQASEETRR